MLVCIVEHVCMINVLNLSFVLYSSSYCKVFLNIVISVTVARSISQNYSS